MAALPIIGLVGAGISAATTLVGGFMQASAMESQAEMARVGAAFTAEQLRMQGAEALATSQRQMLEKRRLTQLGLSKLQAQAAGSGLGATDVGVLKLGEGIAKRGEYEALADLWSGQNRQLGYETQREAALFEGEARARGLEYGASASRIGAVMGATGSILSGVGQYGKDRAILGAGVPQRSAYVPVPFG
jgi:hypothetical protein